MVYFASYLRDNGNVRTRAGKGKGYLEDGCQLSHEPLMSCKMSQELLNAR